MVVAISPEIAIFDLKAAELPIGGLLLATDEKSIAIFF